MVGEYTKNVLILLIPMKTMTIRISIDKMVGGGCAVDALLMVLDRLDRRGSGVPDRQRPQPFPPFPVSILKIIGSLNVYLPFSGSGE